MTIDHLGEFLIGLKPLPLEACTPVLEEAQLAATQLGDSAHHVSADDQLMGARPMARVIREHIAYAAEAEG